MTCRACDCCGQYAATPSPKTVWGNVEPNIMEYVLDTKLRQATESNTDFHRFVTSEGATAPPSERVTSQQGFSFLW